MKKEKATKEEKKKEKIIFNPFDYDHLDKASLSEWVSEFLSRNESFRRDVEKLNPSPGKHPENVAFLKKYMVTPIGDGLLLWQSEMELLAKAERVRVSVPGPVIAHRIDRYGESVAQFFGLDDFLSLITGNEGIYHGRDVLLLAINLNAPEENIRKSIDELLRIHRVKEKGKIRTKKWKYYLMVYDLREKHFSYPEIVDALSRAYPDKVSLFDEKNLQNYYSKILVLINGGYKKYL